jgi:hypothetical protein
MIKKIMFIMLVFLIVTGFSACNKDTKGLPNPNDSETGITKEAEQELGENKSEDTLKEVTQSPQEEVNTEDDAEPTVTPTDTKDVTITPVMNDPILMTTPPFQYYKSDRATDKENHAIKLNMKSNMRNEITDVDAWFINNDLSLTTFQVPNSSQFSTGNLPDVIDIYWKDLIITKAFYDDSYIYCTYGSDFPEGYILNIYEVDSFQMVFSLDFSSYRYSPKYIEKDYDFIQQKINWAALKDNILYISHSHSTYAESSNNMNAYITAIDLSDMSILWRTNALISNSNNFLMMDDVIICGYGFTAEPDYLYQVDRYTGEVLDRILLNTAPSFIIKKDNSLFVRTYNDDYEFEIIQ